MVLQSDHECMILLDVMELRRESMRRLLQSWSNEVSLDLTAISPDELSDTYVEDRVVRLVVLAVGGATLSDPEQQEAMARVKQLLPDVPCVVLSDRRDADEAICAATSGMQAFLSTAMQPGIVNQTLNFVLGGGTYFPREALLASRSGTGFAQNTPNRSADIAHAGLTGRQSEVLERLRYGKSNKHIARELHMQEATVKVHVRQIMRKLGAANRTQVALLAQTSARAQQSRPADEPDSLPSVAILAASAAQPSLGSRGVSAKA